MMEEKADTSITDCEVCFHAFDGQHRRPRCIPCGHTLCTKCVSDNLNENLLLCPFCRAEHPAKKPTDFPVVYAYEKLIQKVTGAFPKTCELQESSPDPSRGLSKKLKSLRKELSSGMDTLTVVSLEVRSQLHQYQTLLKEWQVYHEQCYEKFSAIAQDHKGLVKSVTKEFVRVTEAMKEEEEERQKMKIAEEKLLSSTNSQEVLPAFDEASQCYDDLEIWTQETQKNFPNDELIGSDLILRERAQAILKTLSLYEGMESFTTDEDDQETEEHPHDLAASSSPALDTAGDSSAGNESPSRSTPATPLPTLQEKLKRVLQRDSLHQEILVPEKDIQEKEVQTELDVKLVETFSKGTQTDDDLQITVQSIQQRTPSAMNTLKEGLVYAAMKGHEGQMRYAKMSLQENELYLHVLSPQTPPSYAIIVQELESNVDLCSSDEISLSCDRQPNCCRNVGRREYPRCFDDATIAPGGAA